MIRAADWIIVLDNGKITEQGSHGDLMAAGGGYKSLWPGQSEPEASPEEMISGPADNVPGGLDGLGELKGWDSDSHDSEGQQANASDTHHNINLEPPNQDIHEKDVSNNKPEKGSDKGVTHATDVAEDMSKRKEGLWKPEAPAFIPMYLRASSSENNVGRLRQDQNPMCPQIVDGSNQFQIVREDRRNTAVCLKEDELATRKLSEDSQKENHEPRQPQRISVVAADSIKNAEVMGKASQGSVQGNAQSVDIKRKEKEGTDKKHKYYHKNSGPPRKKTNSGESDLSNPSKLHSNPAETETPLMLGSTEACLSNFHKFIIYIEACADIPLL